jgi:hypothetical protein
MSKWGEDATPVSAQGIDPNNELLVTDINIVLSARGTALQPSRR